MENCQDGTDERSRDAGREGGKWRNYSILEAKSKKSILKRKSITSHQASVLVSNIILLRSFLCSLIKKCLANKPE